MLSTRYLGLLYTAHIVFFVLVVSSSYQGYLRDRHTLTMLAAWIAGAVVVAFMPSLFFVFTAGVAIFNIVVVLVVYKRDFPWKLW